MEQELWGKWNPKDYLEEYHAEVAVDAKKVIESLIGIFNENISKIDTSAILDFGCGPTLYGILSIGHLFKEIYLADYLSSNLTQIDAWIKNNKESFNWKQHTRFVLNQNGFTKPSCGQIAEREDAIRAKIKSLLTCNAREADPMGRLFRERFPVVTALFCADSITNNKDEWKVLMKNISSLVAPKGIFIVCALLDCQSYQVKGKSFPSANISNQDFEDLIKVGLEFPKDCVNLTVVNTPEHHRLGYEKFSLAVIQKLGTNLS